jgi:hypothetical protein
MALVSNKTINTREDLDFLAGTPKHLEFMQALRGTMTRKQDVAVRPDDYGKPEYTGEVIPPIWEDVEDLSTITRFGFSKPEMG